MVDTMGSSDLMRDDRIGYVGGFGLELLVR